MPRPPQDVRKAAAEGLRRRRERAKVTQRPGGTAVGVARARDLVNGRNIPIATVKRMRSFFARHDTDEEREARRRDKDSPANIAHLLWGGTPGRRWADRVLREAGLI
jgi:hypothetical protein